MLYNIEKNIEILEKKRKSDEFKDLVYDLESFIIDNCYPLNDDSMSDVEKLELGGKIRLKGRLLLEYEKNFAFSKLRPVLVELGIPEALKGFRMLQMMVLESAKMTLRSEPHMMIDVSSIVSKQFGVNEHNCERLCRYACNNANPTLRFVQKYPTLEILTHRTYEKVTVKELVDILVWYLIKECKFRIKTDVN